MNRDGSESDGLKDLLAELAVEERESRGAGAITDEDLLAYRAGQLGKERSELVMRVLATEPEWADRMLELARFEEAPETQVEPEELEREWRALEATMDAPAARLLPFRRRIARRPLSAVAAAASMGLALALLSMIWLQPPPAVNDPDGGKPPYSFELTALDGSTRSGNEWKAEIPAEIESVEITLRLPMTRRNVQWETFRVELRDLDSEDLLIERNAQSSNEPKVRLPLPRSGLRNGKLYEVKLLEPGSETPVAEYRFSVVLESSMN